MEVASEDAAAVPTSVSHDAGSPSETIPRHIRGKREDASVGHVVDPPANRL